MAIGKRLALKQLHFGYLIRELRQEMGPTQEQFAAELGVVYPTINRWENGSTQPSPMAMKLVEMKLLEVSNYGQELLERHFAKE
jgi:transcriptional regulator with XRE-family HTH domain